MTTYYRIFNTKTKQYTHAYMKEDAIGKFYTDPAAINRAMAGWKAGLGEVSLLRLQHYISNLVIEPVTLIIGSQQSVAELNAIKKIKFPKPPKYVDSLRRNCGHYLFDNKPYAVVPSYGDDGWYYVRHLCHLFETNGELWMQSEYQSQDMISETEALWDRAVQINSLEQVKNVHGVELWDGCLNLSEYYRFKIEDDYEV